MENEIWKPVYEFPNYEVSNLGRIRREKNQRVIKQKKHVSGYMVVRIWYNKRRYTRTVARLVWQSFNECTCTDTIDHINEDKKNNTLSNLRCIPLKSQYTNRTYVPKTNKYNLTDEIRATIQRKFDDGETKYSLSKSYEIPYNYLKCVLDRGSWRKYL